MKKRILMIEDGRTLVMAVQDRLTSLGYEFEAAYDGFSGLERARNETWDLILVDLMLPALDGESIVKQLRAEGSLVPLIIVTAKNQMADRVAGLKGGADDYITKPFSFEEFLARVEAHLRRGPGVGVPAETGWLDTSRPDFSFGEFTICYREGRVFRGDVPVELPHQAFRLLCLFADHPREVLSTERILSEAWGYEALVTSRTVYVHVALLRKQLRTAAEPEGHIATVRGIGYVFNP